MALITETEALRMVPDLAVGAETTLITELIDQAGHLLAAYCGYPSANGIASPTMESTSYVRYLTGTGGRDLVCDVGPITAVASIYDDPTLDFTSSTYLVDSGDYAILAVAPRRTIRLTSTAVHGVWSTDEGAIKATVTAGYTTIPAGLKRCAQLTVKHLLNERAKLGVQSDSVNGASATYTDPSFLPAEVKQILLGDGFVLPRRFL